MLEKSPETGREVGWKVACWSLLRKPHVRRDLGVAPGREERI